MLVLYYSNDMKSQVIPFIRRYAPVLGWVSAFLLFFLVSVYDYQLFLVAAQAFSVFVAFSIFVIAWNSRRFMENKYLLFIGMAYLFIGGLEFTYIFIHQRNILLGLKDADASSQLLVLAHYLQGLSFLIAPFLYKRRISPYAILAVHLAVFVFVVLLILYWDIFSIFIASSGKILFLNRINSFIVFLIFVAAMYFLKKKQEIFDAKVYKLIDASLFIAASGEIAFIFSRAADTHQDLVSVFLKTISFYLVYKAIVETGFSKPYHLLFRDLKQSQERYGYLIENSPEAIVVYTEGTFVYANPAGLTLFGVKKMKDLMGKKAMDFVHPEYWSLARDYVRDFRHEGKSKFMKEFLIVRADGTERCVEAIASDIIYEGKRSTQAVIRDITEQKLNEKAVQDARIYAESIVNTIRDPLVVLDEELRIVSANWSFYYFCHFEREKAENGLFYEVYNRYWDIPNLKEDLKKVIKNNIPIYNLEISYNFPGIGRKVVLLSILRIYQTDKKSRRFLLSIKDITENKRAEEKLRQSEEKYRNIFDNASDAIATVDLEDNITSWNKSAETMFGWRADEIVGKKFGALIVPQEFYTERGRILKDAFSGKNRAGIETVRMRKNRTKIQVSLTSSPIFDEKREIVGVSGIFRDITLQKQEQMRLKAHNLELEKLTNDLMKFQLAVEHASDLTVITDKDGIVLYANRAAIGITGYSMNEIIGKKSGVLWGRQMDSKFYQDFWNTVKKEKKIFIGEVLNKRKNGEKYYAEMRVSPIANDAGDVIFFVGLERDITQEKEVDKAKMEFVSIASHELRTPLANMSLTVEMILDAIAGPLNSEQKKYLRGIYRDIKGMSGLVDALLNVSRIELRTLVVAPEPASLYEIAENVLKEIIPQVNRKGIKIVKIFDSALPVINVDRNLMRIILQNLLSNAVKYTPISGKIGIEIKKDGNNALIKVSDNGCGVPKDQQGKLFQKLFRARNAIDLRIEGVGLGLYIVKSIVVQCGGKIWVETEENRGTIVFVRIPLEGMEKK